MITVFIIQYIICFCHQLYRHLSPEYIHLLCIDVIFLSCSLPFSQFHHSYPPHIYVIVSSLHLLSTYSV